MNHEPMPAQGPVDVTVGPSVTPHPDFKCPACGSPYFGPIFENQQHVGRYCKGWPSGFDRSYSPCRVGHEERFAPPNAAVTGGESEA